MTTYFKPTGSLDLSTNPQDLPSESDGRNESSGAMQRCKNLRLDENGVAKTRDGSTVLDTGLTNSSGGTPTIHNVVEQAGDRYAFASTIIYKNGTSIKTGLTDARWSALLYNSFNSTTNNVFALNGTDRKRIEGSSVYEWGIAAPTETFTFTAKSGGNLTGAYNIKFTFVRKEGSVVVSESNPSDAGTALTLSSEDLVVTADFTFGDIDEQVTHIRFYRTLTNGANYYYDGEIAVPALADTDYSYAFSWEESGTYISGTGYEFASTDVTIVLSPTISLEAKGTYSWEATYSSATDTTTVSTITGLYDYFAYVSSQVDTALGTEVAIDHNRPPLGNFVIGPNYNGSCFIIKDNLLYYCKAKQPEYWPTAYYLEMSAPQFVGKSACFWNGQLYYFTKNDIYLVQGTGPNTFFPLQMSAVTGAQGPLGVIAVSGTGIYHIGSDGIYLFNNNVDKKISQKFLERIFRGETVNDIPGVDKSKLDKAWLVYFEDKLYFGYAGKNNNYPQYIMVIDFTAQKMWHYDYGMEISAITIDETNMRLLAGDNAGKVWHIEDGSVSHDNNTEIAWEIESKDFTLQTRKHFPRWIKYDVDASDGSCTATGSVVVDGTALQTHTLTESRNTRRRLITPGNGDRVSNKITGSGPVSIYAMEFE